jgi:hypothetical protein
VLNVIVSIVVMLNVIVSIVVMLSVLSQGLSLPLEWSPTNIRPGWKLLTVTATNTLVFKLLLP